MQSSSYYYSNGWASSYPRYVQIFRETPTGWGWRPQAQPTTTTTTTTTQKPVTSGNGWASQQAAATTSKPPSVVYVDTVPATTEKAPANPGWQPTAAPPKPTGWGWQQQQPAVIKYQPSYVVVRQSRGGWGWGK